MKIKPEVAEIASEVTEIIPAVQKSVSEKDIATLNNYADKKLYETTQLSEVINAVPSIVERGGVYLVSAAVGLTLVLLYFSKVPVRIESPGSIVPEANSIPVIAAKSGIVTAVKAKVGQRLARNDTLLEVKPTGTNNSVAADSQSAQTWQAIQQKELEITQEKIALVQLQLQLISQAKDDADTQTSISLREKIQDLEAKVAAMKNESENLLPSIANQEITMPQAGIISQLKVDKPGQSIAKDTVVVTVIPDTNPLVVEAILSDRDIATIKPGMPAIIKVDAYDFREFGAIPAQVSQIVPNLERPGEFIVILHLLKDKLTHQGEEITLLPGLNVQVEINTEEKRLLGLLFSK